MDNYERIAKVGEGTYGVVYKALHLPTGRVCAMKKIRLHTGGAPSLDDEDGVPATAIREVACLREIHDRLINSINEGDAADSEAPVAANENSPASTCVDAENSPIAAPRVRKTSGGGGGKVLKPPGSGGKGAGKSLIGTRAEDHVVRLLDVLHTETRLHLVFEFLDCDLRRYMEHVLGARQGRRAARETALAQGLAIGGDEAALGLGITVDGKRLGPGEEAIVDWEGRGLPLEQVKSLTYQLTLGIYHLHSRRILHRDLKPQNLLISPRGAPDGGPLLKIADFGLARTIGIPIRTYTHEIITLYYRPPEVLLGTRHYTSAVDMWSVGCILAEMATGAPLFTGDSELGQIMKIFQVLGTPDTSCWPALVDLPDYKPTFPQFRMRDFASTAPELCRRGIDLLAGCLTYDPTRRISAKDALTMPYLRMGKKITIKRIKVAKPTKTKLGAPLTPMSASSPSLAGKATPSAAAAMMAMINAKGPYPTPPLSGRPRAPSKLAQSPLTMPHIAEASPAASPHATFLPPPTAQSQRFPSPPTSAASTVCNPFPSSPIPAPCAPVVVDDAMAISPAKSLQGPEISPVI